MATIYGAQSKYLINEQSKYSSNEAIFLFATAVFLLITFIVFGYGFIFGRNEFLKWFMPIVFFFAVYLFHRAYKNFGKVLNFTQGIEGENEVFDELKKLPDNYAVFYDLKPLQKNYNIDFLVSGPTGLFAIEVKSYKGNIIIANIYKQILGQVKNGALKIHQHLKQRTGKEIFIKALLVYSSDSAFVTTARTDHYITVIHKRNLVQHILTQKEVVKEYNIFDLEKYLIGLTSHNLI